MIQQIFTKLNTGVSVPLLGLGVYDMHKDEAENAIVNALQVGYRLIDTAAMYANETEVGNAIRSSGIKRDEIFVTTKVNNPDHGYDAALRAFDASMKKLNIDYIDLYLIHWPIKGKRKETWQALEYLHTNNRVKSIGVANYLIPFLQELEAYSTITPALNQVEFSPFLYQKDLLDYCTERKIQLQAYTPLTKGEKLRDGRLVELASKYQKTAAQIILRWNIQHGVSVIPKSSNPNRLKENFDIFNFTLTDQDMNLIDSFNENYRMIDDPMRML
jgi:diketogulonate reductase-like aldo/keto reductase